jgi:primosomal protein N' (replication factor Y)
LEQVALVGQRRLPIKSPRQFDLSHFIRGWLDHAPKTRGSLKLEVDIDPQSFN